MSAISRSTEQTTLINHRNISILVVAAVLVLSLWPSGEVSWIPYYFQPGAMMSLLAIAIGGCYAGHKIFKSDQIIMSRVDVGATIFGFYMMVRYYTTPESHWSQGTTLWVLGIALAYVVFRQLASQLSHLIWVLLMLMALVQSSWGLLQLYDVVLSQHGIFRITGSFFNPAPFSGFLALLFPLALHWAIVHDQRSGWQSKVGWLIAVLILIVVIPARSRASWLALVAGGGYVLLLRLNIWERFRQVSKILKLGTIGILISLLIGGLYGVYKLKPNSADGRLLIWKVSARMFADDPLFGRGFARFAPEYMISQADYFASGSGSEREKLLAGHADTAYNEFLQMAVEVGSIGLFLFLLLLAFSFCVANGQKGPWQALVLAWIIFASFSYPSYSFPIMILLMLAIAMIAREETVIIVLHWKIPLIMSLFLSVVFMMVSLGVANQAKSKWQGAQKDYILGKYEEALIQYHKAYPALMYQGLFLQQTAKTLQQIGDIEGSNSMLRWSQNYYNDPFTYSLMGENYSKLNMYDQSEIAYLRSHFMVPHRLWPQYLLVKMLCAKGDEARCKELAKKLIANKRKVDGKAVSEMVEELRNLSM